MCGIYIWPREGVRETLLNQIDRGLDWLWIVNKKATYKVLRDKYKGYKKYLKRQVKEEGLTIMHHRKASIWEVKIDNAHPFEGKKFILMHNWTAKKFFTKYGWVYKKETDSETLLQYIEHRVETIEEIPNLLENLCEELKENLWNVIITDIQRNKILFYTDWARESFLHFDWDNYKLRGIYNYKPWTSFWFANEGSVILDFDFNILDFNFTEINESQYYLGYSWKYTTPPVTTVSTYKSKTWNYATQDYDYDIYRYYEYETRWKQSKLSWETLSLKEQQVFNWIQTYIIDVQPSAEIPMNKVFEDFLIHYYWVDTIVDFFWHYEEHKGIRIEEVFKLVYEECFFV